MNLYRLSIILAITVAAALLLSLMVILALGGFSLLAYLKTSLIQMFGFVIAATASLFFFMRLIHQMHSRAYVISMLVFIIGIAAFLSVSIGKMYMFQYPMYVKSYGPGKGPGLPAPSAVGGSVADTSAATLCEGAGAELRGELQRFRKLRRITEV